MYRWPGKRPGARLHHAFFSRRCRRFPARAGDGVEPEMTQVSQYWAIDVGQQYCGFNQDGTCISDGIGNCAPQTQRINTCTRRCI